MNTQMSLRHMLRAIAPWALVLVVPLLINGAIWSVGVVPQRSKVRTMRGAEAIAKLKPRLTALSTEGHRLLTGAGRSRFTADDASAVMQVVQRLAGRNRVQVKESSAEGQESGSARAPQGFSAMPLKLSVTGRFNQLAHWLSDVEAQDGLQVESWTLAPGKDSAQLHQMTVDLTAFLRNAA